MKRRESVTGGAWGLEGDIPEDEESDIGDEATEESQNGDKTAWLPSRAQQSGNDDED